MNAWIGRVSAVIAAVVLLELVPVFAQNSEFQKQLESSNRLEGPTGYKTLAHAVSRGHR